VTHPLPTQDEVISWFERLSNWGRWGPDDRLGTLNHLTPERRVAAARLVEDGEAVSCGWDIDPAPRVDQPFGPPLRHMLSTGEGLPATPRGAGAAEWIGLTFHGYSVTHLDSLAHMFWDGRMYGGRPADEVRVRDGATVNDVVPAGTAGMAGRGVLLDAARQRGVDWLEPGEHVTPDDLEAIEAAQDVRVGPGDLVLLRTGYGAKLRRHGPDDVGRVGRAGWHVACAPWLAEREVAVIGADTAQDVHPSGYPDLRSPLHLVGIVALGLWLIDNCDLEALASACARRGRWAFHLSVAPLRLVGVTGSPVNPLATF
jgi:kynurenine formamidase